MVIGSKLVKNHEPRPAIAFLDLSLTEFPDNPYVYYANYHLARAHRDLGDVETAIRFAETALEQDPGNVSIERLMEELRNSL
jgi:tetratricopeptide (TPR) repeat protein